LWEGTCLTCQSTTDFVAKKKNTDLLDLVLHTMTHPQCIYDLDNITKWGSKVLQH
jgi:hypothetical protein